jgi:septal ring factor EnvC (AmiA/AmiB activator)
MKKILTHILTVALLAGIAAGSYAVYAANNLTQDLRQQREDNSQLQQKISQLQTQQSRLLEENEELAKDLEDAEDKNEDFEKQIEDITDTVGDISRYTSVDPELLKKYSRVFFLSENYTPSDLEEIDERYVYVSSSAMGLTHSRSRDDRSRLAP